VTNICLALEQKSCFLSSLTIKIKPKLLTSILLGLILPWRYFGIVTIFPIRYLERDGDIPLGQAGIAGFWVVKL
jgi:hypothetical protein